MTVTPPPETSGTTAKSLFGNAAKLAQKRVALAGINTVSLPKVYHAIGLRISAVRNLPADLASLREKIVQLEAGMTPQSEMPRTDEASGFAARAKQLAARASKVAGDAAATVQLQSAYVSLGKQAVVKYGERAIPKDLLEEYRSLITQQEALRVDIKALESSSGANTITPKRLVIAGAVACVLLGLILLRSTASWILGARHGAPSSISHDVARARSVPGRDNAAIVEKQQQETARREAESRNRELQQREIALQQRERDIQDREQKAADKSVQIPNSSQSASGSANAIQPEQTAAISNLRKKQSLLLVDSFVHLPGNDYGNLLNTPAPAFPDGIGSLTATLSSAPTSLDDAIDRYKAAIEALQKRPILASLQINEPLGKGRYSANWKGRNCIFESSGAMFARGSRHDIPVTCTHSVGYTYDGRTYDDQPYLLQAGDEASDVEAQGKKFTDDLADELDAVLKAGQWIVYFGLVNLPVDVTSVSDSEIAKQLATGAGAPREKDLVEAIRRVGTGSMTSDAPALYYALKCANRDMLTHASRRRHPATARVDAKNKREALPAASAIQWAAWFSNGNRQEEQVGILECLRACNADWGEPDDEGRTPLMHAMLAKRKQAIAYLCDNELGVTKPDSEGRTPLMRALTSWDEVYRPLLSAPNACNGVDREGNGVLHYCDRFKRIPVAEAMRALLANGASLSSANANGDTPLHILARAVADDQTARSLSLGEDWTSFVRFLISNGADGAVKNKLGETPTGFLVAAGKHELTIGLMFPCGIVFEKKSGGLQPRAIALNDKSVLTVSDEGNGRTKLTKRDLVGREIASCLVEGTFDTRDYNVQVGEADCGAVFLSVDRGRNRHLVVLTPAMQVAYETPALSELDHVAFQPDGAMVALGRRQSSRLFLFKADSTGKVVWGGPEVGPLSRSPESIEPDRVHEKVWVNGRGGVFAICAQQTASHPCSVVAFNGAGKELLRAQPFAPSNDIVDMRGVFPDGSVLCRDPSDPDNAFLLQSGGKVAWSHRLGSCTSVLRLSGNDGCVASVAGQELRMTRITNAGEVVWEAALQNMHPSEVGPIMHLQEAEDGVLFASGRSFLAVVSADGKLLYVANQGKVSRGEVPRIYDDGTVIWPDAMSGFLVGNYRKW